MNDPADRASPGEASDDQARGQARRRRRLAAVFGDVLPEGTRDERPEGGEREDRQGGTGDDWLKDQVPPHHG